MDIIGKADPYCIIKCGHKQHRTQTVNGNCNPTWGEEYEFTFLLDNQRLKPRSSHKSLDIEVWDDDIGRDDIMARAEFPLISLPFNRLHPVQVPLKPRGTLSLELLAMDFGTI
eukprot:NODE_6592_length_500_cov_49.643016_g5808_i0.p1 GENE.NODE_6592_length_500_cov_49.643016_g5808_i0~~NODE_6592_length_500_cov_49.643016_g5808_i0.p1  ORF type:complete len:128 (-),score=41.82 NODE_6592_length_500_cov_49.643016_g5808_i0:116-454(-)